MYFVILDAIDADGLKGSEADVQSDLDSFGPALPDSVKDCGGEVKAGCWRRNRAALPGIDSLIAFSIRDRIRAFDIRGQRDVADAVQDRKEILPTLPLLKTDATFRKLPAGNDLRFQFIAVAEEQSFSNADFAPGPNQAFPVVGLGGKLAGQQHLDSAAQEIAGRRIVSADILCTDAHPAPVKPSWKNLCVVEDHKIARPQQIRKVAEGAIGILAASPLQMKHS